MRFRIDLKIFLFLIIFYLTRQFQIYVMMIIFAIIHELGHLMMGLILGLKPEKIELMPLGLSISFKLNVEDINSKKGKANKKVLKEILIALAGPVTNLIIFIVTYIWFIELSYSYLIIYANLLIFIFNLLPIYPLDGGRVLNGILHIIFGRIEARKLCYDISMIVTIILTAVSSIAILYYKNIAIFLIIVYVWVMLLKETVVNRRIRKLYQNLNNSSINN